MTRMRFKCPGVKSSVISSELEEENYQRNLLPVRDDVLSADEVLGCNGEVETSKILALLVLTKYMQVLGSDSILAMDVDISYPTWIAEKLKLQLLPGPLGSCASDGGEGPIRPVEACAWFEDDKSANESTTCDSGGFPMVQEMELDVEDLSCKPMMQSKKLLGELSWPVGSVVDEDFKNLQVHYSEAAPISSTVTPSEEYELQKSIRGLDDAMLQTISEAADGRLAVKLFETEARDNGMCDFLEMPDSQDVEPCAIPVVHNSKAEHNCEDLSDDLSCLLDGFGAIPSMLDERAPDLRGTATQSPQERGPCSVSVRNTLLEDLSIDSSIRAMKPLQIQNMSEKLKIVRNDKFEQSPSSNHRSCDPGVKITSNSVVFADLISAENPPHRDSMVHDTEEGSGIRHQKRRLPGGAGASVSTSVLKYEDFQRTAAKDDNSDHSTLSDENTTRFTAPPPGSFKFDSTRSVRDLSLMNETHIACKEVITPQQSSEANPKNCAHRENSTRQGKTRLDLEPLHCQQGGSTSVAAASFGGIPWAVTAPPPAASIARSEHRRTEELCIERCSGSSRDVKMMKKQPLVIVASNVMQPDGPVLPQRRSSYQRILALENEQLQVVERERHLPVDLILSPSTCLIVYTAAAMKLNWETNLGLASKGCSAFIVDIIVDCQMKAMSFSFQKCYMVFEGDPAFTSFILQATPKLAVAAAGFGMQVQCFVSGSPQCTEHIALMCIERIRKKVKRPYPSPMTECENDDELFLEQFPSLNPLAAHAILCLDVSLSKFLLWSHHAMADALQGLEVPTEALRLFKLQSEHRKQKERQGPRFTERPEEKHPDSFPFLPSAFGGCGDFETDSNDDLGGSDHGIPLCPSLDQIFELDPLGDGPTSNENITFSPPFKPAFQFDPIFDEEFKSERCVNFWDDPYQLSKHEYLPIEPWPEERPTQRATTQRNSNRSQKPGYIQSSLDKWIGKLKGDRNDPNGAKQKSKSEFLGLAKASIPSETRQQDLFPTLDFQLHRREKEQIQGAAINITPAKRSASALNLFRRQKGISRPLQKKLKPLSRPDYLRSAVVEVSSVQAAQAHLAKRFCFKPVTNPSRAWSHKHPLSNVDMCRDEP